MQRFRLALLITILFLATPAVSGWTLQSWSQNPAGSDIPPGTPVTAGYSLHFDSWMTGSTFENDNSLIMYTDLANPQWVVTKVEPVDDQPAIVEQVPVRQGMQVRLDGWTLSYSRKRFDLNVQLTGTIPARDQSGTISVVRLQEVDASAKPVAGTLIKKEVLVFVPTPEPTPAPAEVTINMTPAEVIVITPGPVAPATELNPTKRVTYSPGPDPLLVTGVLAGLLCLAAVSRRRE
jgi:hypothetical protein